jgi:hypothetical protein
VSSAAIEKLQRPHRKIGIDTSVFIYRVEESAKYVEAVDRIFAWLEVPSNSAATSTITMLELLVRSYQQSAVDRVNKSYALLSTYPNL